MTTKHKKFGAALMAVLVLASGMGLVAAAPGTVDGSQTDTTAEVYLTDGKTVDSDFNASGDTTFNLTLQSVPDTADVAMNVTHDGTEYYSFSGDFGSYADGDPDTDATTNGKYHAFADSNLDRVPMGINENVSLTVTWWNQSATNPTPENITIYVNASDERSVQAFDSNAAFADVETVSPPFYKAYKDDYSAASADAENIAVNGTNTNIVFTLSDSNVSDSFANATELSGTQSTGDFIFTMASVDASESGDVPVFYNSAPDWYDASESGSYMTYDESGDMVTLHTEDDEFSNASAADVSLSSDVYRIQDIGTVVDLNNGFTDGGNALNAVISMVM